MFLVCLFPSIVFSAPPNCVAPLKTPAPVPSSYKPVYSSVIIRHGARSPQSAYLPISQRGHWVCDSDEAYAPRLYATIKQEYRRFKQIFDPKLIEFLPNCRAGDLLLQGMEQHYQLGKMYNKYFRMKNGLFKDGYDLNKDIFVRATDFDRTLRSAESFINGAFHPKKPFENMSIVRGADKFDPMRPSQSFCKDLNDVYERMENEEAYIEHSKNMWAKIKHIADFVGQEFSYSNLNLVANWVITLHCNEQKLPSIITEKDIEVCHEIAADFNNQPYRRNATVAVSYMMKEVMKVAKAVVEGRSKFKFSLFSAHDSTVAAFINYFKYSDLSTIPPYASHILTEVFKKGKKYYIRWSYNGNILHDLVSWDDFLLEINDCYQYCLETP